MDYKLMIEISMTVKLYGIAKKLNWQTVLYKTLVWEEFTYGIDLLDTI